MHPNITAQGRHLTGSAQVFSGPGRVYSLTVQSSAAGLGRVSLEDAIGSGTEKFRAVKVADAVAGDTSEHYVFLDGLKFNNGCFYERSQADILASITYVSGDV